MRYVLTSPLVGLIWLLLFCSRWLVSLAHGQNIQGHPQNEHHHTSFMIQTPITISNPNQGVTLTGLPLPPHSPHIPHLPPQSTALATEHGLQHVPCLPLLSLSCVGSDISKQPFEQTVQQSVNIVLGLAQH